MITGDSILMNVGTRMVLAGRLTLWTDHKRRSVVLVRNPETGNEDKLELNAPRPWWVIQWVMQMIVDVFEDSPILEMTHQPVSAMCEYCCGAGGAEDRDGNWVDCPACGKGA